MVYAKRLILKALRRLEEGIHPELELGRFLTERARFPHIAPLAGALEYVVTRREPITLGILQAYVANEGDAWRYTLDLVEQFFEDVLVHQRGIDPVPVPTQSLLELTEQELPPLVAELLGGYLETARLLGQRTAELHLALASEREQADFAPEPFTSLYQRSLYQSMRNLASRSFELLRERLPELPEATAAQARAVLERQARVMEGFQATVGPSLGGMRIRCHGDYHLGQLLYTGNDFVIVDFEGEPARPLSERRLKRSPLRDVAGMLRSFDYAAHSALKSHAESGVLRPEDVPILEPWARFWSRWVQSAFLRAYLAAVGPSGLIATKRQELEALLRALLLDKSVYELAYELNHRPDWVRIPIHGILDLTG